MADRSIRVRLEAVISQYKTGMAEAAATTKAFGQDVLRVSAATKKHQESLTLLGGAAIGAGSAMLIGLGSAAKAAMNFESSFAGVRKTVDASESEFTALANSFKQLSTEIPVSVDELNRIGEMGGQLGIPKDSLVEFTKTIAMMSETTDLTADSAAMAFGQLGNVLNLTGTDFDRLGSTIVDLGNKGASTESWITDMTLRLSGTGAVVGLAADEIIGLGAAMANAGIPAEAGGTAMSRVLQKLNEQVATGGPLLENFAKVTGMSATSFATAFREKPGQAVTAFLDGLHQIQAGGGDLIVILEALGITEARQVDAMSRLAAAQTSVKSTLETSKAAWTDNNALVAEAEKRFKTFESRLEVAKNKINLAKIEIGNFVLTAAEPLISAVGLMAEGFAALPGPVEAAVGAIGGLGGVALIAGGAFLIALPRIKATKDAIEALGITAVTAQGKLTAFGLASRAGVVGGMAVAGLTASQAVGSLIDKIEEAGKGTGAAATGARWYARALEFTASRVLWALPIIRRLGHHSKEAGDETAGAGNKAKSAGAKLEALAMDALDAAGSMDAAAASAQGLTFSFSNLGDNQAGVTPPDTMQGYIDSLASAKDKLHDLGNEASEVFKREKWQPSEGDFTLDEIVKDREKFYKDQQEREVEFYNDQAKNSEKSASDRARDISKTEHEIAGLQDKIREGKRSALTVLREAQAGSTDILGGFVQDLTTLADSGNEVIARKFAELGPTSAAALREAVDLMVNSPKGFAVLKGEIAAGIDAEKALADTHWDKWKKNFEEKGKNAGDAASDGLALGLSDIATIIQEGDGLLSAGARAMAQNIASIMEEGGSDVVTQFQDSMGNVVTIFRTADGDVQMHVQNMVTGLVSINDVDFDPLKTSAKDLATALDIPKKEAKELLQHLRDINQQEVLVDILLNPKLMPLDPNGQLSPFGGPAPAPTGNSLEDILTGGTTRGPGGYGSDPYTNQDLADILAGQGGATGDRRRAAGGPVRAGVRYWVGEDGPEPFVAAQNGYILSKQDAVRAVAGGPRTIAASLPSSSSSSVSSGDTINLGGITVHARTDDAAKLAKQIVGHVSRELNTRARVRR